MRFMWLAALLAAVIVPSANAAEIRIISPGVTLNAGLKDLAADFTKKTGVKTTIITSGMSKILNETKTAVPPADVVFVPLDLMGSLALDRGIKPGSFTALGRVEIGLAVKAGAPHPDVSTMPKLLAVLKSGKGVLYSNPASGSMEAAIIDRLLKRPEFAGVHGVISSEGEGGQALRRGEGDMALQLVCEVYPYSDISLVGPLPPELGAHIDSAVAISARSTDPKDAAAFITYITNRAAAKIWKAQGLDRF